MILLFYPVMGGNIERAVSYLHFSRCSILILVVYIDGFYGLYLAHNSDNRGYKCAVQCVLLQSVPPGSGRRDRLALRRLLVHHIRSGDYRLYAGMYRD